MSVRGCASTTSFSGMRAWDISSENVSQSDVILSKVCALEFATQDSFSGTFTMLDQALDKVCTIDSKVDVIEVDLNSTNINLVTIISKLDIVEQETIVVSDQVEVIRIDDFGGTWTSLDELQSTLCEKFDDVFSDVDVIESKLDQLAVRQESHFADTFTTLQVVSEDVLETLVELNSLSEQLITDLSEVDVCILTVKDIMESVDSKLDKIDNDIEIGFSGTFTAIDDLQDKVCTVESKIELLEIILLDNQSATFTALAQVEAKLCTVESKVEVVEVDVSIVDSFVDEILINMSTGNSKLCVIDSKLDVVDNTVVTLDSKVDVIEIKTTAIQDDLIAIDVDMNAIAAKACTVESRVDVVIMVANTIESSVDIFNSDLITIESKVDVLTMSTILAEVCTIESRIDIIDIVVQTIESKVEIIDNGRISLDSKLDIINPDVTLIESKLSVIESKVEVIETDIITINTQLITIESKVDVIDSEVDIIDSTVQIIEATTNTIESKVDVIYFNTETLLSKVCTIESSVEVVDSKVEQLSATIDSTEIVSVNLNQDMRETWTVLAAIEEKICTIELQELTVSSKLDTVDPQVDFSGVFTVLEVLTEKSCMILDTIETIESSIDAFNSNCITDLGESFTAIDSTVLKVCTLESKVDVLVTNVNNIIDSQGIAIGIPLTQADFSDTFSITEPGRYHLTEDIDFNPGGNSAIYIASDDVHIDMCDRTIRQTTANTGIDGIVVADGYCNISIENGTIRDFTGSGIEFLGEVCFVRIENIALIDNGSDQLLFNSLRVDEGIGNIIVRNVMVNGAGADCMDFNNGSGIFVIGCNTSGTTGEGGIQINACDYVCLKECIANNNSQYGFAGAAVAGNSDQQFGMTNFVIDNCKAAGNTTDGFRIIGFNKNGVVKNCTALSNADGIRFAMQTGQIQDSTGICMVYNISSNNSSNGIQVDGDSSNNYFAFNQMWENGSISFLEDTGEGPNSVLGNFAFRSSGTNYSGGNTGIATAAISETGSFPSPEPTYWINVDMLPT